MARNHGTRNMTVGSPAGHIFYFALPLLAGSFLQQFYNMVDSWVVGNYVGDGALAAVGVGTPVIFMFSSLFMGLANGGTVVIAQFFGAGKPEGVRSAIDTIYTAFICAAIPLTILSVVLVDPLLHALQVETAAYAEARTYLLVVCAGLVGTIGYNLNAGILRGLGNSRTTLLFLAISAVMNIVLDLVFVLALGLDVLGVALATILAQAASWLFGLYYINRAYPAFAIHPFCFRFDGKLFREIMRIGLPSGLHMSLVALGSMVVMSKINSYGHDFTAAYNVGSKLDSMAFLPIQSLASAVVAYVGQNMGAQKLDRVRQGVRITLVSSVVWAVLMLVLIPLGPTLIGFFSDTPAVIEAGTVYLRCIMPPYILFSVMFCLNNAMQGAGDSMFSMVNAILSLILVRVPMVYLLANRFGPDYMYYGIGIGWATGCVFSSIYYLSGRWKRRGSVAQDSPAKE
ncbi:MAG: MATE family efflux transporter [Oscillibacter sp.]|nr:MATE family efflux transporter [Oscillibacter sp.]